MSNVRTTEAQLKQKRTAPFSLETKLQRSDSLCIITRKIMSHCWVKYRAQYIEIPLVDTGRL